MTAVPMIELWRGGIRESVHTGHAVVFGPGGIELAWGDPEAVIFPRSSVKMIQALPLLESGAADAAGLSESHLAFACASHSGAALHRDSAAQWLAHLGLHEQDLRCGAHMPQDPDEKKRLTCSDEAPCQLHNNCSGKHVGFLTLNQHIGGGSEYVEVSHPIQQSIKTTFEEVTDVTSPGFGIDGCSAPNFATTVTGLARAMQLFAAANPEGSTRERAAARLTRAMASFPELVAGEGRACTELMRAMGGRVAVKTGAEAVYVAILPEQKRGIALKIVDGGTRGAEAAITALLIRLGVLDRNHPVVEKRLSGAQKNWRGLITGEMRLAPGFG
ncbi:asparaginase [Thioclava sp. BHET1]|uniref:L-asparaginase n=1 Tax=Thioclava dalianensis TaxID=1185766 RepID=A0A074TN37_9RHOB|nr:asparaginase [Thioclava dalianensis]KEP70398.1 L-asparaginase [Thioclava dalianensis]TMV94021.1 asparaginase [Thioclava sp. BHET1]SFN31786.1 asparaginase [Thioclava dalianensis]